MARKPPLRPDNPEQFKRFQVTAREVGAKQQGDVFERVLDRVARPKAPSTNKPSRKKE